MLCKFTVSFVTLHSQPSQYSLALDAFSVIPIRTGLPELSLFVFKCFRHPRIYFVHSWTNVVLVDICCCIPASRSCIPSTLLYSHRFLHLGTKLPAVYLYVVSLNDKSLLGVLLADFLWHYTFFVLNTSFLMLF